MRKIKGLVVKKDWAKVARKAQFELLSPEFHGTWPIQFCGIGQGAVRPWTTGW